jgi:S-adenosylmethionine uptake transporter
VLLPLEYSAFIWSALMGWLMFGEKLTVPTLVGAVLIVLGCWIGTRPSAGAGAPAHIEQTAL